MPASRQRQAIATLLDEAGVRAAIASVDLLGIGSAGLNARGMRDEDGIHARVSLDDGSSVIYREYTSTGMVEHYVAKERAVFDALRAAGMPAPIVLASAGTALLLSDEGGLPLEEEFRAVAPRERPGLWSAVGAMLRRLHDVDTSRLEFLHAPVYQRPWTRFVPYFAKTLRGVKKTRPDLAAAIDELLGLRGAIQAWLDARPRAVCYNAGFFPPGLLVRRGGACWECTEWLSLGYYVSIFDPARDVVGIEIAHQDWTGEAIPSSFYEAYGPRPDELAQLVYGSKLQLGRGAAYVRGKRRTGWGPPPHTQAVRALDDLPETVARLRSLLES